MPLHLASSTLSLTTPLNSSLLNPNLILIKQIKLINGNSSTANIIIELKRTITIDVKIPCNITLFIITTTKKYMENAQKIGN